MKEASTGDFVDVLLHCQHDTEVTMSLPICSDRSLAVICLRLMCEVNHIPFLTDSAGDVWRHTSLPQHSHIAEDVLW